MTVQELVTLSSQKVRRDSDLMAFYIESFKAQFGKAPNCAGCTFSSDFIKLKSAIEKGTKPQKEMTMRNTEEKTFVLNKGIPDILTYKRNGRNVRKFAKQIDEAFALEYLTLGSKTEIAERKKQFRILPAEIIAKEEKKKSKKEQPTEEVEVVFEPSEQLEEAIQDNVDPISGMKESELNEIVEQTKKETKPKGRPKKK